MSKVEDLLIKTISGVETAIDRASFVVKKRFDLLEPISILCYYGFGNANRIYLNGRVLEEEEITQPEEGANDSVWVNMRNMWKRYESDEIPYVSLRATFQGQEKVITTDSEGYFEVTFEFTEPLPEDQLWHQVEVELLDKLMKNQPEVKAMGEVMVPPVNAQFGVISDVDDTILVSHSTEIIKKAQLIFFNNARTRLPFEGVSAFYQALQKGGDNTRNNPIFYVSSSPWNLFDLLDHFCEIHDIPRGPLLLRDLGISTGKFIKQGHMGHKVDQIEKIFNTYPDLQFVLIGDSGQQDVEIYESIADRYTDKILAIYIRDVSKDKRDQQVYEIAGRLKEKGIDLLLCEDTELAAKHARQAGFIGEGKIRQVEKARKKDEEASS